MIWLSRFLSTWRGKIGLGLVIFATLLAIAFMNPINGTFSIAAAEHPGESHPSQGVLIDSEHFVQGPDGDARAIADIQVLGTNRLLANSDEHLTFVSVLPEGGFIAAAWIRGGAAFVYKFSSDGDIEWRTALPEHTRPASGGITSDGQYWIGGSVGDANSDAVQIVSKGGALTERHTLSTGTDRRFLICAAERNRQYIQISSVGLQQYLGIPVPSLSMTNAEGARLWEVLTPFDRERRIAPIPQQFLSCAGIFLTQDEHVLAAQQILVWPVMHSSDEIQREWATGRRERPATLVLAFDLAGHEIAHLRDDDTGGGLLIPTPHGAVLFESPYLKPGLASSAPVDAHVHVRWLNSSLKDITSPLILSDGQFDVINGAYVTPQGGLLLAGCSGTRARVFVRYVSSHRSISVKKELTQLGNCGGAYWFALSTHPNEALLLSEAAPGLGPFVTSLRISD